MDNTLNQQLLEQLQRDETEQLQRDEGEILSAYNDSRGFVTIGTGICIDKRAGCGITKEEDAYLLGNRLSQAISDVLRALPWTIDLDEPRFGVLVNMRYNMGTDKLLRFQKMLLAVKDRDWPTAKAEMLASVWAVEVGPRATRLGIQMETGAWM